MLVQERIPDRDLIRSYSDAGMLIRQEQTGALYAEAIDVVGTDMTYVETDIPAEDPEPDETEDLAEAARILMGVTE